MSTAPLHVLEGRHADGPRVDLGDYTYTLYPQRIGRLRKHISRNFEELASLSFEGIEGLVSEGFERAWKLMKVLIPDLMPLHEFCGFESQEDMENPEVDEGNYGPDFPQVVYAFETALKVNRFDLFKSLGKMFTQQDVVNLLSNAVTVTETTSGESQISSSTTTPPTTPTPSSTTAPTSTPSAG